VDDKKIIKEFTHTTDLEEVQIMTDILHYSGTEPKERKKIEDEKEAWRTFDALSGKAEFEEKERRFIKALNEKDQALNEKDQALNEKDQALNEKDQLIANLMRKLDEKK
jgi:hypothetical protein